MILKKPYAFLIKNFKLIHILLILPIVYILYKTSKIVSFFNSYARSGVFEYTNNLAGSYINIWIYLAIILILLVVVIITYLFIIKKKSVKLYIGIIAYYIILAIGLTICYSALAGLEDTIMETTIIRIYRDVSLILYIPQYFFLIYDIIRGIGFDIKRFDFNKDLKELEIEETDSEEVEISFDHDNYKTKRKIRRYLREIKYYFFENKFIIIVISIIAFVSLGIFGFYNYMMYHRTYKEMQVVNINGFKYVVNNSILTNLSYRGNEISDKYYYLAIGINITNNMNKSMKIEKKDLTLEVDGNYYYPIYDRGEYYVDLGTPYHGEKLKPQSSDNYVIVYELPKSSLNKNYNIVIVNEMNVKKDDLVANKKNIKINPKTILSSSKVNEVGLDKVVDLSTSEILTATLKITEVDLSGYYSYTGNDGYSKIVSVDTAKYGFNYVIIAIKDELISKKDNYYSNKITKELLYNNHGSVFYEINGKTYLTKVIDVTPKDLEGVSLLQIDKKALNSDYLKLVITLRDKSYYIKLK